MHNILKDHVNKCIYLDLVLSKHLEFILYIILAKICLLRMFVDVLSNVKVDQHTT